MSDLNRDMKIGAALRALAEHGKNTGFVGGLADDMYFNAKSPNNLIPSVYGALRPGAKKAANAMTDLDMEIYLEGQDRGKKKMQAMRGAGLRSPDNDIEDNLKYISNAAQSEENVMRRRAADEIRRLGGKNIGESYVNRAIEQERRILDK
jgi:hypothetical protein